MRRFIALASIPLSCLCAVTAVHAAQLQRDTLVRGGEIHLSDIFTDVDPDQDVVLGEAPAPGDRITVGAAQLSAIAAQFGVDWTSASGREYRVLRRDGTVLNDADLSQKVRDALVVAGVAPDSAIVLAAHPLLMVETGSDVEFTSCKIDDAGTRFHGEIVAKARGQEVARYPIAGSIEVTARIMVASRDLPMGAMLGVNDLAPLVVARSRAVGDIVVSASQAVGQMTAQPLRSGMPVRLQMLHRPYLVAKGSTVLMILSEDGIDVSARGQAMEGGALDDSIQVLNVASHAILTGNVVGPAQVTITPHSIPSFVPSWKAPPFASERSIAMAGASAPTLLAP